MKTKVLKLIILITCLSKKMKSVTTDLDKIADLLQDGEILAVLGASNSGVLSPEDYD